MHTTHTQRRRTLKPGLTLLVFGAVLGITGFASAPAGAAGSDHQVTICHATSAGSNPYSTPSPNKWQIMSPNGHGWDADDIIPPFPAGSKGSHTWAAYPGLNWDVEGQAIHARGCNVAAPEAGSVTLDKATAGDGQPAGTTDFDFSVVCDSGSVADTSPTITPDSPAAVVATGVEVGDSCTIGETNAAGAASTTYSVNGGGEQAGPVQVTIAGAEQVVSVVVTNTYRCAEGQTPDGQGGCSTPCVGSSANNQCVPCPTGGPDGQGGCSTPCVGSSANNQCVPCPTGTPDGQGSCTTDACPGVDGLQASATDCPPFVEDSVATSTATPTPSGQSAGTQLERSQVQGTQVAAAELPRTGTNVVPLALLGLGLILMGAGALRFAREQTARV